MKLSSVCDQNCTVHGQTDPHTHEQTDKKYQTGGPNIVYNWSNEIFFIQNVIIDGQILHQNKFLETDYTEIGLDF